MMQVDDLQMAMDYVDQFRRLMGFKSELADYNGATIKISLPFYDIDITLATAREQVAALIKAEETMLRNTFELWGLEGWE